MDSFLLAPYITTITRAFFLPFATHAGLRFWLSPIFSIQLKPFAYIVRMSRAASTWLLVAVETKLTVEPYTQYRNSVTSVMMPKTFPSGEIRQMTGFRKTGRNRACGRRCGEDAIPSAYTSNGWSTALCYCCSGRAFVCWRGWFESLPFLHHAVLWGMQAFLTFRMRVISANWPKPCMNNEIEPQLASFCNQLCGSARWAHCPKYIVFINLSFLKVTINNYILIVRNFIWLHNL